MEQIPWNAGAIVVLLGNRPRFSGTLAACLHYWRDMPTHRQVTSFIAIAELIDGRPFLEPEDIEKLLAGQVPAELQAAH